jgi:cytochrome P450
MEMMGLPIERFAEFRDLALQILDPEGLYDPAEQEARAGVNAQVMQMLSEVIAARHAEPKDDLVSALIGETVQGQPIGPQELLSMCYVLFLGGLDTVTTMLGNIFAHLARYPDQQRELRENPDRIVLAVEEFLRIYGPVTAFRIAVREIEIQGQKIMPGEYVSVSTPIVNQDPKLHDNPSQVRFDRKAAHVALGGGIHKCLGMHLARLELQTALEEILKAIPQFRLKDGFELGWFVGNITFVPKLELQWD